MRLNVIFYFALRLSAWILPLIPLRVAYVLATVVGTAAYYVLPGPRRGITMNLSRVLGDQPASRRVRRAARCAFCNDTKNWIDTLRIARLRPEQILASVHVDGWEHVEQAAARGKGLIIVSMHLGNFDLVGQVLTAHGYRVTVPVERMKPERLFDFLVRERSSKGIHAVPVERAPREMIRALRAGELVAIAGDRNIAGRGVRVPFFDVETAMPKGPASLARFSGAPLLVGAGVRTRAGQYAGFASAPVVITRTADPDADDRANTARIVDVMEEFISRFPEQWLAFSPVWVEDDRASSPAPIEQSTEAAV